VPPICRAGTVDWSPTRSGFAFYLALARAFFPADFFCREPRDSTAASIHGQPTSRRNLPNCDISARLCPVGVRTVRGGTWHDGTVAPQSSLPYLSREAPNCLHQGGQRLTRLNCLPREPAMPIVPVALPGRRAATRSSAVHPAGGRTYTRPQIAQLYDKHHRGGYAGREAEWARQEADIIATAREGRGLGGPYLTK
jgi:hypothetical protein